MKILVVGAGGMIGHKMVQSLTPDFSETYGTIRRPFADYQKFSVFAANRIFDGVDVLNFSNLEKILNDLKPSVILNCVGVTLRKPEIQDLHHCLELNSFLPHRLKCWAAQNGARVVHFSTDCVFDGADGDYSEYSQPTAKDNYGRTKYLGEIADSPHCLTLRGSMIGRELFGKTELLEWTLAQRGKAVKGFGRVIYSGTTTVEMGRLVRSLLGRATFLSGIFQVSSTPISKYALLEKINKFYRLELNLTEDCNYVSNKVLLSTKLKAATGFVCPSWDEMIEKLVADRTIYELTK